MNRWHQAGRTVDRRDATLRSAMRVLCHLCCSSLVLAACFKDSPIVNDAESSGTTADDATSTPGSSGPDATSSEPTSSEPTSSESTSDATTGVASTGHETTSANDTGTTGTGGDSTGASIECNPAERSCPDGQKCQMFRDEASVCVAVLDTASGPGQSCHVAEPGIDDCGAGLLCLTPDVRTAAGTCVELCAWTCPPASGCGLPWANAVAGVCVPNCDPLLQDCPSGSGCYQGVEQSWFVCLPNHGGAYGSPCEYVGECSPGLLCTPPNAVPNCASPHGCCSELCDLTDPLPQCSGMALGQECLAYFEADAPPEYSDVGICAVP